ncbi:hypothetical protein MMB68_24430 [Priestia sp. Y58]|uniref:hypothetical protein n=1 Tax=Priestia sp. Y58 TaxID=2922804 RepID=UPI0024059FB5|nr:hypothetical protein [Priestia sp. Y58]MDG0032699.1 hypothetical protein [Priestia sp. Y58]
MEDKLGKFERLAEKRVIEAKKRIRLIGNLANKHNYEYTEQHVKQIIDTLENEMKTLKNRFRDESLGEACDFAFKIKQ